MDLDIKQQVLVAVYTEYQKDLPKMKDITAETLGISRDQFWVALDKLDNENLVNNIKFVRGGNRSVPAMVNINNAKMSISGIDYVEQKLEIEKTLSAKEKAEKVMSVTGKFGFEQLKDFSAKVVAEIIGKAAGM